MPVPPTTFDYVRFDKHLKQAPERAIAQEIAKYRQILQKNPRNGDVLFALGMLCAESAQYDEAMDFYKKALKRFSQSAPVYAKITELLVAKRFRFKEAIPYYKKWLKTSGNSADVLTRLARCELAANRLDDALASMRKAERLLPNDPVIFETYATVYAKRGDVDETRKALQRCKELGGTLDVTSRILNLPGEAVAPEEIDEFVSLADALDDQMRKLHAYSNIGLAYERIKEFDKAFDNFGKANEIGRSELNKNKELTPFGNVKTVFTSELLKRLGGHGRASDSPIFIVGMPRSGTTLIESILAGHGQIIDNGELPFVLNLLKNYGVYSPLSPRASPSAPDFKFYFDHAIPDSFEKVAERYFNESGYRTDIKKYQVDKLPHNFFSVGMIHLMFPNAKIIHCRRHPVDCALSCFKSSFSEFHAYATDLEFLGQYYKEYWKLMEHWRSVLPGKMHEVFYEDTVVNTEAVARGMIQHIGLEWDENCLDHTSSKRDVSTASQWQVRQPIYTSSVAKWKHYETQLQPMIKAMGSCVEEYESELAALEG
ncbi:MAG: sulfotransferase [Rhizobiaceae bacterium]|nr:sulfotransferase [Rhizobiaceae bacterium]